jgi:CRP-like cAMP-binding protein
VARPAHSDLKPFVTQLLTHSRLSEDEQQAIFSLPFRVMQVQRNRDFVKLGERVDHSCLILEGLAARFDQSSDGLRQITALHIPGDMADLHSVVLPYATSALQALTTTTVLQVPHSALRRVAARYQAVAETFWRACMIDAAILSQWVVNVGRRESRARMAHLLCEMAVRYGAGGEPRRSFAFPVTQNHLADATAITPVHTNRTLMALRKEGLAQMSFGMVEILDWPGLQEAGEFDPAYLANWARPSMPPLRLLDPDQTSMPAIRY